MYKRQVEDEVARDLVEHSIGQAIRENQLQPVAPPTVEDLEIKSGEPFKFTARVEVRSQVTPKDYSGLPLSRRPAKVTDEAGRGGAGGLPAPADRVQAGRGPPADRRHRPGAGRDVRPGGRAQAEEAPGGDRSRERRRRAAAGSTQPPARKADRRRPGRGRLQDAHRGGRRRRWRASRCTCTSRSRRCARRRCPRSTTRWRRTRARRRRWRGCAARCASGWSRRTSGASRAR